MKLNDKQKEEIKAVINNTVDEMFRSNFFLRRIKKGIFLSLEKRTLKSVQSTEEDKAVARYVKISRPTDEVWMDLTAAALQSLLVMNYPELHKKMSTIRLGKALSKAGALKSIKNGINVYRIKKVRVKKQD